MFNPMSGRSAGALPRGTVVGTYETYEGAQRAMARLAKAELDLPALTIVGSDLRIVEQITGKLSWGRVALNGAFRGVMFGILFTLISLLLFPDALTQGVLLYPLVGVAVGMLLSITLHSLSKRRRTYASVQQVVAAKYEIIAAGAVAFKASTILGSTLNAQSVPASVPQEHAPQAHDDAAPGHEQPHGDTRASDSDHINR
ncbi:general stress protein [Humidisolicoccus flavus]|uniref:general stress protein n=1 Tax=Humidisolicoccus flavus TaxID=3111414 RepID=UPI00325685FD